jgi:hypothetical protein
MHAEVKRLYPRQLIAFYEKHLQFKEPVETWPYKPV